MDFHAFDSSQLEAYKAEAKERWGQTAAYAEFEEDYDASKDQSFAREMQSIFEAFGKMQSLGSKPSRCTGSGSYFAGLYHRELLHLHQGNLAGARSYVC